MERDLEQLRLQCPPPGPRFSAQIACSGCSERCPKQQAACLPLCDAPCVCGPSNGAAAGSPQESTAHAVPV